MGGRVLCAVCSSGRGLFSYWHGWLQQFGVTLWSGPCNCKESSTEQLKHPRAGCREHLSASQRYFTAILLLHLRRNPLPHDISRCAIARAQFDDKQSAFSADAVSLQCHLPSPFRSPSPFRNASKRRARTHLRALLSSSRPSVRLEMHSIGHHQLASLPAHLHRQAPIRHELPAWATQQMSSGA